MSFANPGRLESSLQDKLLGGFVLIAISVGVYLFLARAGLERSDDDWVNFHTQLSQSFGITAGADVTLSGVAIGRVTAVSLRSDSQVRVSLALIRRFSSLYTQGSRLKVKSQIGLETVFSGVGFVFESAGTGEPRLEDNAYIDSHEPQSLDQLLDKWKVEEVATQVSNIVDNLDRVVNTLGDNQHQLVSTLENTNALSQNLLVSADKLPQLLDKVSLATERVNSLLALVEKDYRQQDRQLGEVLGNINRLTTEMNQAIKLLKPALERAPELSQSLMMTSMKTGLLMDKLNNHWLLGSDKSQAIPTMVLPADALVTTQPTQRGTQDASQD